MNVTKSAKKQKTVLILLLVVSVILLWQLYELFAGDKTNSKTAVVGVPAQAEFKDKPATATPASTAAQLTQSAAMAENDNNAALNPSNNQSEYLRLVNEYQMAQLQRMIAEDNEAIAIARQNAAKAMTETSKLMGGGTFVATNNNQANTNEYQLVYTGQQGDGSWTATLKKNNQTFDVIPGGKLTDGSQVISIDDNGVLLQQGEVKKLVTFSGVTQTQANKTNANTSVPAVQNSLTALPKVTPEENIKPAAPAGKEVAEQTEHALTATPDNPTTPTNAKILAKSAPKPIVVPVEKQVADQKPAAKAEQALTATPDNPTVPTNAKTLAKSAPNPVGVPAEKTAAEQKPATKSEVALKTVPAVSVQKNDVAVQTSRSPLQQPMVAFSHTTQPTDANKQILAVNPSNYTLQLTSDHQLDNLQRFIKKHKLADKAIYFQTKDMQGRGLYILIYGQYPSMTAAKDALDKLPESVKEEGAFVVKYSTVQTVLKKAG